MEMLERRKQVVRKGGKWIPTETWTSSYNNPVVTKYHDLRKRYTDATIKHCVQSHWTSLKDVPRTQREDFRKSCPWYFAFRKLDSGPRSPPPQSHTLRELSTSERNTASRREDNKERAAGSTSAALPAKVVDPFLNLRPMLKRPTFLDSPPLATPTPRRLDHGNSRQTDSDSDSSSVVELVDYRISRPKKLKKTTPSNFSNVSEADKVDLKRLKRQLGVATRLHTTDGMAEPNIFKYIPTERDRYLQADTESRGRILKRARTHLLFRVLRDLESFILPQCLADCGLFMGSMLQKNYSARADQIRRIVKAAGGKVFKTEKKLNETNGVVRIYLLDDGPETKSITRTMDAFDADQDVERRVYNLLEFGRFLRRRFFHHKI